MAIGTATLTLVGIGSVLTLGATWAPNRAVADPSAMQQPAGKSMGDEWVGFDGDPFAANEAEQTTEARSFGSLAVDPVPAPGAICCVGSDGSCGLWYGTACPDGTTSKTCPCMEPV